MTDSRPVWTCSRCVLSTRIPGVRVDASGICEVCRKFDGYREHAVRYFKTEAELSRLFEDARREFPHAPYDCLLLFSGGKDSAYTLIRLLELGVKVLTYTFDNGFISPVTLENIQTLCQGLKVDNVTVRLATINQVMVESLVKDHAVCTGCFRSMTLMSTRHALDHGIPVVMTGLGRGQIYETKLDQLYQSGIFHEGEVERMIRRFQTAFHRRQDPVGQLSGSDGFKDPALEKLRFVDFFRYSDVTKEQIFNHLTDRLALWKVPADTGTLSTNCLIDDVGIEIHRRQRGFHIYAVSYAWEVRLGHTTREAALEKLEAQVDQQRVGQILHQIGYPPSAQ